MRWAVRARRVIVCRGRYADDMVGNLSRLNRLSKSWKRAGELTGKEAGVARDIDT
jgi:hypothetical protein